MCNAPLCLHELRVALTGHLGISFLALYVCHLGLLLNEFPIEFLGGQKRLRWGVTLAVPFLIGSFVIIAVNEASRSSHS